MLMNSRREFIKVLTAGGAATLLPLHLGANTPPAVRGNTFRFGLCADVHKDIMHDADARIEAFVKEATARELDFIIQLGDFCRPYDHNLGFLSLWNSFAGKKFHVIGNHDMDGGFTREQVVDYWKSAGTYYSFDLNGYHFIVLDGNDEDPSPGRPAGYARYIGREQLQWMENDLRETDLPCLVFSHQGLDNDLGGIHNATQTRLVLERANEEAGRAKVLYAFSGHHHQDYSNTINGIHYIQINSMSYQWLGEEYQHIRYSDEIDRSHPWIKYTVPYQDPLWAIAELSADHSLRLYGRKSSFVGPSPEELGVDLHGYAYPVVPHISDKTFAQK